MKKIEGVEKNCTDLQYREMGVENLIAREKYRRRIIGVEGGGEGVEGRAGLRWELGT